MADILIKEPRWIIYKITHAVSGKVYVGLSCQTLRRRWLAHIQDAQNRRYNSLLHKAIRRHGAGAFLQETICETADRAQASNLERRYITELKAKAPAGYNLADGGYGGATITGRKRSPETREKIRVALTGKKMNRDAVERMAAKRRGRPLLPHHAAILRVAGRKNKGKIHTAEQNIDGRIARRSHAIKQTADRPVGCYPSGKKYRVRIQKNGKRVDLGSYDTLREARDVYRAACDQHLSELKAHSEPQYADPSLNPQESQP